LTSNCISSARYAHSEKSHKNNKSEERKKERRSYISIIPQKTKNITDGT
jgi:hypothetical protein